MADPITITHVPEWRRRGWDAVVPSRPAWLVTCADHEQLGKDSGGEPWGYSAPGRARGVATKHRKAYHREGDDTAKIVAALELLDHEARVRVLAWAADRFGVPFTEVENRDG
jgi:hypothetical protein